MLKGVIDEEIDVWYWTAWALSGENAMEAERIYQKLDIHIMMLLYGIKIYGNSFQPEFD